MMNVIIKIEEFLRIMLPSVRRIIYWYLHLTQNNQSLQTSINSTAVFKPVDLHQKLPYRKIEHRYDNQYQKLRLKLTLLIIRFYHRHRKSKFQNTFVLSYFRI